MSTRVDEYMKAALARDEAKVEEISAWIDMKRAIDRHNRAHRRLTEANRRLERLKRRASKEHAP